MKAMNRNTTLADARLNLDLPDLEKHRTDLQRVLTDSLPYLEQYEADFRTRFCLWEGQSRDGRRWQRNLGTDDKVRPWDGASDVRPFVADQLVNEDVEIMMSAFRRAQIQVTALRSAGLDVSGKINLLLNWRFRNHLREEVDCELEKAAQWRQTYGICAMGVWQRQERRLTRKNVVLAELIAQANEMMGKGDPSGAMLVAQIADPMLDDKSAAQLREMTQGIVDKQGALKILRELRTKGSTIIPNVQIAANQPCWETLRCFLDVFFPVETANFRKARWTARRRLLTAAQLDEGVNVEGWDREWAEKVWEQRGKSFEGLFDFRQLSLRSEVGFGLNAGALGFRRGNEELAEVYDTFTRGIDAATGVPVLTCLKWSPLVPEIYGHYDLFGYDHGELPFVDFVRERVESAMADSRSVPEIATTGQNTVKTQRDAANDYTQMTTLPPLIVPPWRSASRIELGPAAQIPERKTGELRWMSPPVTGATTAQSVEDRAEIALARYFGHPREGVDKQRVQAAQEHLIGKWLMEVGAGVKQTLKLDQQFMSDIDAEQNVGGVPTRLSLTRADIQGDFAIALAFDPRNLDMEMTQAKLKAFKDYVTFFDKQGVMNYAALAKIAARWIDADIADQVVGTPQQASQREADDEKNNLAQIAVGIEPPMAEDGQNFALRLQTLMQAIQTNPWLARRLEASPDSYAILEARIKHLTQQAQQFGANAQTGRVGAQPGLQQLAEDQAKQGGMLAA